MKTNAIIRIVLFSLVIVLLSSILLGVLLFGMYITNGRIHFEEHNTDSPVPTEALQEIDIQYISPDVRNIEIDWVCGNIQIMKGDVISDIVITETSPSNFEYKMVCKQTGQTLKIEFAEDHEKFHLFGNDNSISKDLSIRVPANWNCKNLEIDAAATDVTIIGMEISEMDFDGASGLLNLDNCEIGKLDVDTASGDVEFYGILNKLDFDAASAKFVGQFYRIPERLTLDAMSGDVILTLPEDSGFTLELDALSGSFYSDFTFQSKDSLYVGGDGACKIKVSGISGDVSILKGISRPENCDH